MERFYRIASVLFSVCLCCCLSASDAHAQMRDKPLDQLDWYNPWTGNGNMAGLTLGNSYLGGPVLGHYGYVPFSLKERAGLSEAYLGLAFDTGEYKNVYDPKSSLKTTLGVESYGKIKSVYLYGRFDFKYDYDWGNTWRGSKNPYRMPFMLADPIEGNITDQTYSMEAGIGMPFGYGWAFGVDVSYDVGIMAKLKDLRNSNTDMDFRIAPGISYGGEAMHVGLSVGYERATEKVEYTQVASDTENYLYYLSGMWVANSYGYSSAEKSRFTGLNGCYGNFTIDIHVDQFRLYNDLHMNWGFAKQTETGYNNLEYGSVNSMEYTNLIRFQYADRHRFIVEFAYDKRSADRTLQQQELDPASSVRRYVTYGTAPCWSATLMNTKVEYTYRNPFVWELCGGVNLNERRQNYLSSPVFASQTFASTEPYLIYSQYICGRGMRWKLTPALSYRFMTKNVPNEVTVDQEGVELGDFQLLEPLYQEADFFGSNRLDASMNVCCDFWRMYVKAGYDLRYAPSLKSCRHSALLTVGIAF